MKKLLSILTLLVVAVIGTWAQNQTVFLWRSDGKTTAKETAMTATGGTATFYGSANPSTESAAYNAAVTDNDLKASGSKGHKLGTNTLYLKITLTTGTFQAGDIIYICGYNPLRVGTSASSNKADTDIATSLATGTSKSDYNVGSVTLPDGFTATNSIYVSRAEGGGTGLAAIKVVRPQTKTIKSQDYAGVKKGTLTLTENKDFTKVGNVITLADSHKTPIVPTDVKLINHRTFDDSSSDDVDVDVEFGKTASEGYFTGTATIASTEYTVKVPHDATPSLEADKANITVTSAKIATGTAKIHLSGVNLAGTNVTLAFASTVAGLSIDKTSVAIAEGAVDTDVTVSYQSNIDVAKANVNLTISTTGVSDIVIPVTYSSTEAVTTIADVTESIVWDFANAGSSDKDISSPDQNNNVPFANADGFKSGFGYDKLSGKGQYFYYNDNKCYQGSQLKFHTTVPGNIVVVFSNTGSSDRPYRYLSVNGVVTDYNSKKTDKVTTEAIKVPAGDVNIVGIMGSTSGNDCVPTEDENMLRIYKVTFTPDVVVTSAKWATTTTPNYPVTFDTKAKVYVVASAEGSIQLTQIAEAPANTPVIVNAAAGSYTMKPVDEATAIATNLLRSKTANNETAKEGDYALGYYSDGVTIGFGKLDATGVAKMTDDKAFIPASLLANAVDFLPFVIGDEENETTSINSIENGELRIENSDCIYNLAGQKVSKDYKGIVIVNGKKVIRK